MFRKLNKRWTEDRLRCVAGGSKEDLRALIEDIVGLEHPAKVFGQGFFDKVWARTPHRSFAEAKLSKASAFAKAAAAYLWYSK